MGAKSVNENCDPGVKDEGYNVLDIVKHAVNSVMHMVTSEDRVCVVAFKSTDELVFPLTLMTKKGRNSS